MLLLSLPKQMITLILPLLLLLLILILNPLQFGLVYQIIQIEVSYLIIQSSLIPVYSIHYFLQFVLNLSFSYQLECLLGLFIIHKVIPLFFLITTESLFHFLFKQSLSSALFWNPHLFLGIVCIAYH